MLIRDESNRVPAEVGEGGLYIIPLQEEYEILDHREDCILFIYNNTQLSLHRNPATGEWWLMNGDGLPRIIPKNYYYAMKCGRQGWLTFPVPKNGCASLLKSALHYDGQLTTAETKGDEFAWAAFNQKRRAVEIPLERFKATREALLESHRAFIVSSPERERVLRWMNWVNTNRYNKFYTYDLPPEKLAEEILWSHAFVTKDPYICDPHAVSQRVFRQRFADILFDGDREGFDKRVETVELKDLPSFYRDAFGAELVKNNITPEARKIFKWDSLSPQIQQKIEEIAEK